VAALQAIKLFGLEVPYQTLRKPVLAARERCRAAGITPHCRRSGHEWR